MRQSERAFLRLIDWGRTTPVWIRYMFATMGVAAVTAIRVGLWEQFSGAPFLLYFPVIVLLALAFDNLAGFYATLLSAVCALYFLLPPTYSFDVARLDPSTAVGLALFVVIGFLFSTLLELLRRVLVRLRETKDQFALLLRELNHRTLNDFQSIQSLLTTQALAAAGDPVRAALEAAAQRVSSIGTVYRRLVWDPASLHVTVDSRDVLGSIVSTTAAALEGRGTVLHHQIEAHPLLLRVAIATSLILNEALTNIVKYAFPGNRTGQVHVRFYQTGEVFELAVMDDGVGFEHGGSTGLGTSLMTALAGQLRGSLTIAGSKGGAVQLRFPADMDETLSS